jgi:hypothetical protein
MRNRNCLRIDDLASHALLFCKTCPRITPVFIFWTILALMASTLEGATKTWNKATGDWSVTANWTGGRPTSNDDALIDNGGTAGGTSPGDVCQILTIKDGAVTMSGGSLTADGEEIGAGGSTFDPSNGMFSQSGGTNQVTTLILGSSTTSNGTATYNFTGGTLIVEALGKALVVTHIF